MSSNTVKERVQYNENVNNGLIFNDEHYIPEELLLDLLTYYVDYKTLHSCQLVCKKWNILMKNYIWRKKAELMINHTLPLDLDIPWITYYLICHKKPLYRNLIKNHLGQTSLCQDHDWTKTRFCEILRKRNVKNQQGSDFDWKIIWDGGDGWAVESPPRGVPPLPDDPVFEGKNCCFVTSFGNCKKEQTIDLVKEGISEYLLDYWQPTIKVSEWFSSRWDCGATYTCLTELIKTVADSDIVMKLYNYTKIMEDQEQNQWFKFEHEFKNYGRGLRKIKFCHQGKDTKFWAGHYGSKMAGACVILEIPESMPQQIFTPHEQLTSLQPCYPQEDPNFLREDWSNSEEESDLED